MGVATANNLFQRSAKSRVFRTYNEDGSFIDYEICHSDLEIQILEKDAYIYSRDGNYCIDYSPKTLGTEKEID